MLAQFDAFGLVVGVSLTAGGAFVLSVARSGSLAAADIAGFSQFLHISPTAFIPASAQTILSVSSERSAATSTTNSADSGTKQSSTTRISGHGCVNGGFTGGMVARIRQPMQVYS